MEVETWLIPPVTTESAYHTRIHKLTNSSSRNIVAAEAGFAIHSHHGPRTSERRFFKPLRVRVVRNLKWAIRIRHCRTGRLETRSERDRRPPQDGERCRPGCGWE